MSIRVPASKGMATMKTVDTEIINVAGGDSSCLNIPFAAGTLVQKSLGCTADMSNIVGPLPNPGSDPRCAKYAECE